MSVIRKPLLSEKVTGLTEKFGQYGFIVDRKASKEEIKKEIENIYNVSVASVRTMVYAGKRKVRYTKKSVMEGRTAGFKKAIITLNEGSTIDFYSNI